MSEYMCGFLLVCNYRLFTAPVAAPSALRTFLARVSYIFRYLFNARIGLRPDQLPPFAVDDRSYIPNKTNFLLRRSLSIVWMACVAYAIKENPLQIYIADLQHPHEHLISRLGEIDAVALAIRVYYTLLVLFEMYLGMAMPYATLSCLAVAVFNSDVADWPPLFGHVSEAYTLRRWYQCFWHKLLRKPLIAHAGLLQRLLLPRFFLKRLPPSTRIPLQQSFYVILTFVVSGLMHTVSAVSSAGWYCTGLGVLRHFTIQGAAITLETLLILAYRRCSRASTRSDADAMIVQTRKGEPSRTRKTHDSNSEEARKRDKAHGRQRPADWKWRALGYFWVWTFWTLPLLHILLLDWKALLGTTGSPLGRAHTWDIVTCEEHKHTSGKEKDKHHIENEQMLDHHGQKVVGYWTVERETAFSLHRL
ncbi:MAG: hypothetical protein Q9193_002419 [Seirophora villosa]